MSKQLTMKAGVAMFAALALAVALAILAFAYQPVAAQSTSADVTRSFSAPQVATGGTVDVTITLNTGLLANVSERLPAGWTYQSVMPSDVTVTENGQMISFAVAALGANNSVTYTVMAPSAAGSGEFSGTYSVPNGASNVAIGGDDTVRVRAPRQAGTGETSVNGTPKPAAEFSPISAVGSSDVTLTVTFSVSNRVDGSPSNTDADGSHRPEGDAIEIMVPAELVPNMPSASSVTAMQNGEEVGRIHIVGRNIVINEPGNTGHGVVQRDDLITLTATGLTLASDVATDEVITISQTGSGRMVPLGVYDPDAAPTDIKAYIDANDSNTLKIEFKVQTNTTQITVDPAVSYLLSNSNVSITPTTSASGDHSPMPTGTDLPALLIDPDGNQQNTKFTITVSKLTDLAEGDKIRISQLETGGSGYSATVVVGGPTVSPGTADVDGRLGGVLSSKKADTAVSVKLGGAASDDAGSLTAGTAITGGRDIVVSMPQFQLPDSIDEDTVIIDGRGTAQAPEFYGNPASVAVSGSNITLSLPTRNTATGAVIHPVRGSYQIVFKQSAGIKTPNSAGTKTITVRDRDAASDNHELMVEIVSHISVDSSWVRRGETFTVTGKGINNAGDATVHLYSGVVPEGGPGALTNLQLVESSVSVVLGQGPRDDGTVETDPISTARSEFIADAKNATAGPPAKDAQGVNLIVMVDAAGTNVGHTYIGILPSVSLDVTDVRRTGEVVVKVSDWYYGDRIDRVRINGILVNLQDNTHKPNDDGDEPDPWVDTRPNPDRAHEFGIGSNDKAEFTVVVDRDTRLGEMQVDLRGKDSYLKQGSAGSPDIHKQTVQVGFFPLTLTPSTAVTEQVMQIEGEEFLARTCITSIMVGERSIEEATNGDTISADTRDCVDTDSNGKLTATFRVPRGLMPGTHDVVVRDDGNRVGEAELVIPKPMIELDPMTSQRGSTVTVVGVNFPADDVVTIDYRGVTVEAAQTDTVGNFRATFQVPITAPIGADHEVLAASENKADGLPDAPQNQPEVVLTAKETHHVSDETLDFDRERVAPGEHLGIIAGNLPLFTPVSIVIGDRAVAGKVLGEDNASDGFGNYVDSVLVPQLPPGITIVELTVHTERGDDVRVAKFVEITNIVTRPTDEVFADLIEAGQLTSVWRYRIDETGSDWDSFDPQFVDQPGINDLELVSTNDIVWIRVTENVTFQGAPLFAGWNLRTLE